MFHYNREGWGINSIALYKSTLWAKTNGHQWAGGGLVFV